MAGLPRHTIISVIEASLVAEKRLLVEHQKERENQRSDTRKNADRPLSPPVCDPPRERNRNTKKRQGEKNDRNAERSGQNRTAPSRNQLDAFDGDRDESLHAKDRKCHYRGHETELDLSERNAFTFGCRENKQSRYRRCQTKGKNRELGRVLHRGRLHSGDRCNDRHALRPLMKNVQALLPWRHGEPGELSITLTARCRVQCRRYLPNYGIDRLTKSEPLGS